jgi:hypothetical protein
VSIPEHDLSLYLRSFPFLRLPLGNLLRILLSLLAQRGLVPLRQRLLILRQARLRPRGGFTRGVAAVALAFSLVLPPVDVVLGEFLFELSAPRRLASFPRTDIQDLQAVLKRSFYIILGSNPFIVPQDCKPRGFVSGERT